MPVEFEYKYVLSLNILKQVEPWQIPHPILPIRQGYLAISDTMNLRVRNVLSKKDSWFTTLKQKIGDKTVPLDGRKTIEIEQEITAEDGLLLWEVSNPKLTKSRHVFPGECGGQFLEMDIFYSGDEIYFILLEVEMPQGSERPCLPDWIKKHILLKVGLTDDRFSSTKLAHVEQAKSLYEKVLLKYQHG